MRYMIKPALAIAFLFAQAAVPQFSSLPALPNPVQALRANQDRWNAAKALNYEFTFRWLCCNSPVLIQPVVITVREGQIVSIRYVQLQSPFPQELAQKYKTVDALFALLRDNLYELRATFHPDLGFPTLAFSGDWEDPTDSEIGFTISDLKINRP
jgi:hypothetical protein